MSDHLNDPEPLPMPDHLTASQSALMDRYLQTFDDAYDEFVSADSASDATANAWKWLFLFDSPERLPVFRWIQDELPASGYWHLLGEVWIGHDLVYRDLETWRELFGSSRPEQENLMTEAERARLAGLPERVEIFRGFGDPKGVDGISWTLDRERAVWFARRGQLVDPEATGAWVASRIIGRESIVALLDGRNEAEVIVLEAGDALLVEVGPYEDPPEEAA